MTYLNICKKPVLSGIILLVFFFTAIFFSCQKTGDLPHENSFNAPAAKEWFYATFKKTNEYTTAATTGKQLPDWKTGRYKKTGNMEMVEYDLVQQKKTALVAPTGNRFEDKRIAEAALNRALFVKEGNETKLFIIQFIPGADYAKTNGYDISKNSFTGPDKNFTGKLLVKNWNNELVKGYNITNGKKTSVIKQIVKENAASRTDINPDCYYSYTAWFEQDCTTTPIGDNIAIENCSEWQMMWENITETYCPVGPSECELLGLDQEACMCQMLGICNGGGGEQEDCSSLEERLESIHNSHEVDNTVTNHTSTALPNNEWEELYQWRIYRVSWPCNKEVFSNEKATVQYNGTTYPNLPSNARVYKNFAHVKLSHTGTTFGYVLSYDEINNHIQLEPREAKIKVWFTVTTEVVCGGSPLARTTEQHASQKFNP